MSEIVDIVPAMPLEKMLHQAFHEERHVDDIDINDISLGGDGKTIFTGAGVASNVAQTHPFDFEVNIGTSDGGIPVVDELEVIIEVYDDN